MKVLEGNTGVNPRQSFFKLWHQKYKQLKKKIDKFNLTKIRTFIQRRTLSIKGKYNRMGEILHKSCM